MNEIILATSNQGKIKELQDLLAPITCISQESLGIKSAIESGLSFIENALIKARHASAKTGKPALADDSGLVVPILKGNPGIYSARYAGTEASDAQNIELLLKNMLTYTGERREAYFYCAIAVVQEATDPTPLVVTGRLNGYISTSPSGTEGFGYDPVFYLPQFQCTMAQLPLHLKNQHSHRAQALKALGLLELG